MFNTKLFIYLIVLLFITTSQLSNCYWPQRKFDESRTNHIGFFPKHAEWTTSIPKLNTLQDLSCLILNTQQSTAYTIISNSTSSTRLLQIDLIKGNSKLIDLSSHVNYITPIGAVMDDNNNYYVLARNYITSNTILIQINVMTGQVVTRVLDNYGIPYSIVYSRNSQLIVIVSDHFIGAFNVNSLNQIWIQENMFPSTSDTSSMLVREENNGKSQDVLYVLTKVIQKYKISDGFRFDRIISIPVGQPKYMTYLGVEGLIAVISIDYRNGVNYISVFNYENGDISSIPLENFCGYPVYSFETGGHVYNEFHLAVPCYDFGRQVNIFVNVASPRSDNNNNITIHEVFIRSTQQESTLSLAYDPNLMNFITKTTDTTNMYEMLNVEGDLVGKLKSGISGQSCETFTSSNSMLYSFCLMNGGLLNIESRKLNN